MQAYHHYQHNAIFLAGLPDVKGSRPNAESGQLRQVELRKENNNAHLKKETAPHYIRPEGIYVLPPGLTLACNAEHLPTSLTQNHSGRMDDFPGWF